MNTPLISRIVLLIAFLSCSFCIEKKNKRHKDKYHLNHKIVICTHLHLAFWRLNAIKALDESKRHDGQLLCSKEAVKSESTRTDAIGFSSSISWYLRGVSLTKAPVMRYTS
jgi:hypothetical protein